MVGVLRSCGGEGRGKVQLRGAAVAKPETRDSGNEKATLLQTGASRGSNHSLRRQPSTGFGGTWTQLCIRAAVWTLSIGRGLDTIDRARSGHYRWTQLACPMSKGNWPDFPATSGNG